MKDTSEVEKFKNKENLIDKKTIDNDTYIKSYKLNYNPFKLLQREHEWLSIIYKTFNWTDFYKNLSIEISNIDKNNNLNSMKEREDKKPDQVQSNNSKNFSRDNSFLPKKDVIDEERKIEKWIKDKKIEELPFGLLDKENLYNYYKKLLIENGKNELLFKPKNKKTNRNSLMQIVTIILIFALAITICLIYGWLFLN